MHLFVCYKEFVNILPNMKGHLYQDEKENACQKHKIEIII